MESPNRCTDNSVLGCHFREWTLCFSHCSFKCFSVLNNLSPSHVRTGFRAGGGVGAAMVTEGARAGPWGDPPSGWPSITGPPSFPTHGLQSRLLRGCLGSVYRPTETPSPPKGAQRGSGVVLWSRTQPFFPPPCRDAPSSLPPGTPPRMSPMLPTPLPSPTLRRD